MLTDLSPSRIDDYRKELLRAILDIFSTLIEDTWNEAENKFVGALRELEAEVYATDNDQGSISAVSFIEAGEVAVAFIGALEETLSEEGNTGPLWSLYCKRMEVLTLFGWASLWDFGSEEVQKDPMGGYIEELQKTWTDDLWARYPEAQVAAALATKWNVLVWGQDRAESEDLLQKTTLDVQGTIEKQFPKVAFKVIRKTVPSDLSSEKEELPSDALLRKHSHHSVETKAAVQCFRALEKLPPIFLKGMAQTCKQNLLGTKEKV